MSAPEAAIILAAGQGTRLRPLTDDRPKCLVEYKGKPIIRHTLDCLRQCGIRDVTVVAGYRAEALSFPGVGVILNEDFESTNMVHTLFCAREKLLQGAVVCYGDIVFRPGILRALLEDPHPLAITVDVRWRELWQRRFPDPLEDAETLKLGPDGRILELGKKPGGYGDIQAQYMGLIKVSAEAAGRVAALYDSMDRSLTYDGQSFDNMYMTTLLQCVIDAGISVQGVQVSGGWAEIDSPSDLEVDLVE